VAGKDDIKILKYLKRTGVSTQELEKILELPEFFGRGEVLSEKNRL